MSSLDRLDILETALGELGVREVRGDKHNSRILEYHQETSLKASKDEVPWCAAFVNWVLDQVGLGGTGSARARSFLKWGEETQNPLPGEIVVLTRGNPRQGHVGFYLSRNKWHVYVLGGNQGNSVSIKAYPLPRVLSYRGVMRSRVCVDGVVISPSVL